jgi:hypothetical protein
MRNNRVKFARARADAKVRMLKKSGPMSNGERQRRFRASHPGYNRKYNGHPTAAQRRKVKQMLAEMHVQAEAHVRLVLHSTICKPLPLMLPAPVEMLVIPGMNTFGMIRTTESVPLARARAA